MEAYLQNLEIHLRWRQLGCQLEFVQQVAHGAEWQKGLYSSHLSLNDLHIAVYTMAE